MTETKIIVLDDDPTGSQTVHSCLLLTRWDVETLKQGLQDAAPLFFILTNTRGMSAPEAEALTRKMAPAFSLDELSPVGTVQEVKRRYFNENTALGPPIEWLNGENHGKLHPPRRRVFTPRGAVVVGRPQRSMTVSDRVERGAVLRGGHVFKVLRAPADVRALRPALSVIVGRPDVATLDGGGELRAVARRHDRVPILDAPRGNALRPRDSVVGRGPDVSADDDGGELGAVARGRDAHPRFRVARGGELVPVGSGVLGDPDVAAVDDGGEPVAGARGGDARPVLRAPDGRVPGPGAQRRGAVRASEPGVTIRARARADEAADLAAVDAVQVSVASVRRRVRPGLVAVGIERPDVSGLENRRELSAVVRRGDHCSSRSSHDDGIGPRGSGVVGNRDGSVIGVGGEPGAVPAGRDAAPVFRVRALGPALSAIVGGPDVSPVDYRGEFRAVIRGRDSIPQPEPRGVAPDPVSSVVGGGPDVPAVMQRRQARAVSRRRDAHPSRVPRPGGIPHGPRHATVGGGVDAPVVNHGGEV